MPPRLNKRQLREQEELFVLRSTEGGFAIDDRETPSGAERSTMVCGFCVNKIVETSGLNLVPEVLHTGSRRSQR
jgi:hypothetical protein